MRLSPEHKSILLADKDCAGSSLDSLKETSLLAKWKLEKWTSERRAWFTNQFWIKKNVYVELNTKNHIIALK